MAIALYVNHFRHANADRQAEIDECLRRNIDNPAIDRVVVLGQSGMKDRFASPKVAWISGDYSTNRYGRPTFRNFFELVNRFVESPDDLSIVSNSDIYFDDSLKRLETIDLEGQFLALTRWESKDSGAAVEAYDNSQDTWIFHGRVRPIGWTDFSMGVFGCDDRLAFELKHADYLLANPCYDLRSVHLHRSGVRFNGECIPRPWVRSFAVAGANLGFVRNVPHLPESSPIACGAPNPSTSRAP